MKRTFGVNGTLAALFSLGFLFLSCTSILTTEGTRTCTGLRPGDYIQVTSHNDQIVKGVFCELKRMDFQKYVGLTQEMAQSATAPSKLPVPGEKVKFTTVLEPRQVWHGTLVGYCAQYLWVRLDGNAEISHFYLAGVTRLAGWDGRMLFRDELRTMVAENKVPLMTVLALRTGIDTTEIAFNRIKRVEVITPEELAFNSR